jgi:hypothetical protein
MLNQVQWNQQLKGCSKPVLNQSILFHALCGVPKGSGELLPPPAQEKGCFVMGWRCEDCREKKKTDIGQRCRKCTNIRLSKARTGKKRETTKTLSRCEICGGDVWAYPAYRQKGRGRFCSRNCYYKWRSSDAYSGPANPKWKRIKKICEFCQGGFWAKASKVKRGQGRFCSVGCYAQWQSKNIRGEVHPNWSRKEYQCDQCGKTMSLSPCQIKAANNHFCSDDCLRAWRTDYFAGAKHPQWLGGISKYGYSHRFDGELKDLIRARDGYKCQICGVGQHELDRALDVHHIDYNKLNDRPENLVALCHVCHVKTNFGRKGWRDKFQSTDLRLEEPCQLRLLGGRLLHRGPPKE